jgi:hypothetical protein
MAAVLALVVVSLAGCSGRKADLGLQPEPTPGAGTAATGTAEATSTPKSETTTSQPSTGSGSVGTGVGSGSKDKPSKNPPGATGMEVRIMWWNDTAAKKVKSPVVVFGATSFAPGASKKKATGTIGPVPFDAEHKLIVYPTGRGGKGYTFTFKIDKAMAPASETDAIQVEVSDDAVKVLGSPVVGFSQTQRR